MEEKFLDGNYKEDVDKILDNIETSRKDWQVEKELILQTNEENIKNTYKGDKQFTLEDFGYDKFLG